MGGRSRHILEPTLAQLSQSVRAECGNTLGLKDEDPNKGTSLVPRVIFMLRRSEKHIGLGMSVGLSVCLSSKNFKICFEWKTTE